MAKLAWQENRLKEKALDIRRDIITMLANSQTGHTGGSLSCTDFAAALFFHEVNLDPSQPKWPDRDFLHFSIGHVTPVIYSTMAERGFFPLYDLLKFRKLDGQLQGHPSAHDTPGLEVSAGSLGQGLSIVVGAAMASKMDSHPRRCYCVMGDGEQQEGSIWEAVMSASHFKLDNILGIVDYNGKQIDGNTKDVMNIDPLDEKYRSFGWHVITIDGHDMSSILDAFREAEQVKGKPSVILAKTIMGKGVSFMEDDYRWHGKHPSLEQAETALAEMGTTYKEWRQRLETAEVEVD